MNDTKFPLLAFTMENPQRRRGGGGPSVKILGIIETVRYA